MGLLVNVAMLLSYNSGTFKPSRTRPYRPI